MMHLLGALAVLLFLFSAPVQAQRAPGDIGLGGQIGEPSGVTVKVYNPGTVSYDFLAAWDLDNFFFMNVHGLYERHLGTMSSVHLFFGPGGFIGVEDRPGGGDDDAVAGVSGSFGLNVLFDRFEVYAQVTPRLAVIPETDGDVGGGLGFRYYF